MTIITYSLTGKHQNSNAYYHKIADFTNKVLTVAENSSSRQLDKYIMHISECNIEKERSRQEYIFDFLILGTFWTKYIHAAAALSKTKSSILIWLYAKRSKNGKLKPFIDFIRGILSTFWLLGKKTNNPDLPSIIRFNKLIFWMEASGEFREEVKRLKMIYHFLQLKKECEINLFINSILNFSEWFEFESINEFSDLVFNVDVFLRTNYKEHLLKEDVILCGRRKVEYLLNMVGAEIMNRSYYEDFNNSAKKALLLPACMKKHQDNKCKAKKILLDHVCTGCSSECNINKYRRLGIKKGFEVHIIPHSSSFTEWLQKWAVGKSIGVIGVACPLNLITGELELKSLDIPAQCVLLDYCGCRNHWDKKGFSTDINEVQLMKLFKSEEIFYN